MDLRLEKTNSYELKGMKVHFYSAQVALVHFGYSPGSLFGFLSSAFNAISGIVDLFLRYLYIFYIFYLTILLALLI